MEGEEPFETQSLGVSAPGHEQRWILILTFQDTKTVSYVESQRNYMLLQLTKL